MFKVVFTMAVTMALGSQVAVAQPDTSFDTITVVESTTISYNGQTVDYFLLDIGESQLRFIQDSAYVKLLGFIEQGDTSSFPEPIAWMKITGPGVGDSWPGMVIADNILLTKDSIVGTKIVNVPAGSLLAYEIAVRDLSGTYLGEEWYSAGVGLVGWNLIQCNESFVLELASYSVSGGGAFWPHQLGDEWVFRTISDRAFSQAPQASITVDGSATDWGKLPPMVQDPAGDDTSVFAGADVRDVYVATDGTHLYLMANFWDGSPDTAWALAETPAYAFLFDIDSLGNTSGFMIDYEPAPVSQWYVTGLNLSDLGIQVAVGNVVEMSVPPANLGFYSMELPRFSFVADSRLFDVSCHNDVKLPAFCPISQTGDVQGDQDISSADIVFLINFVLKAGATPVPCAATGDVNCNGTVGTSDIIYLVNKVFKAGPLPCDVCSLIPGTWACP